MIPDTGPQLAASGDFIRLDQHLKNKLASWNRQPYSNKENIITLPDNNERTAIEAAAVSYLTAFVRADVAGVLAAYADDGVLMGPGRPASVGKKELAAIYPEVFSALDYAMKYDIQEVDQISSDWGFVRSNTNGTVTDKATGISVASSFQELFLIRKADSGEWQIARYCTTKISPA